MPVAARQASPKCFPASAVSWSFAPAPPEVVAADASKIAAELHVLVAAVPTAPPAAMLPHALV